MLTEYEHKLAAMAIKRKTLFLALAIISVIVGPGLAVFYAREAYIQPGFDTGIHFVLVILILLDGGQNLREYRYAKILETVILDVRDAANKS